VKYPDDGETGPCIPGLKKKPGGDPRPAGVMDRDASPLPLFAPTPPLHQALMPRPDGRLPNMWEPLRRPFKLLLGKVRPLVPPPSCR